jgi:hypothetical protein
MKRFTHGIMVINPKVLTKDGGWEVEHFVGYWEKPEKPDYDHLWNELLTDKTLSLKGNIEDYELFPASQGCVDHYNSILESEGAFLDDVNPN